MKVTQKLIAKHAGVSQSAVSMILKGRDDVAFPVETRERVARVAEDLGYFRRTRPTGNLGFLVPEVYAQSDAVRSRFYGRFLDGAVGRARSIGYHVLLETWPGRERMPEMVTASKVDGLVLQEAPPHAVVRRLQRYVPVVFLNTCTPGMAVTTVMPDNRGGVARAVRLLHEAGHRRVAFFGIRTRPMSVHLRERLEGYLQAAREHGLDSGDEFVSMPKEEKRDHSDQLDLTGQAVDSLMGLKPRPTAVVSYGDSVLLPFIALARGRGWLCPDHFSAVGFDNIDSCNHSQPPLTSVDQPMEEMGAAAVDELAAHVKDPERAVRHMRFECGVHERASVRRV